MVKFLIRYYYLPILVISFIVSHQTGHFSAITGGMLIAVIIYTIFDIWKRWKDKRSPRN